MIVGVFLSFSKKFRVAPVIDHGRLPVPSHLAPQLRGPSDPYPAQKCPSIKTSSSLCSAAALAEVFRAVPQKDIQRDLAGTDFHLTSTVTKSHIMASEPVFVLPGDHIDTELIPSHPKKPLRLGPGLRHVPPNDVLPTLAGQFVTDRQKNTIRVETTQGRVS